MIIRRRHHQVPGLNTTSTADISFMLLIFFLVTTSMDVDKGLSRQLPPVDKSKVQQAATNVEKDNLMTIKLQADNALLVNDKPEEVKMLKHDLADFIFRRGKKHLISLTVDRDANYDAYFQIQNQLVAAYNQVRNQKAQKLYHRDFAQLSKAQKDQINDVYPQRIAESYVSAGQTGPDSTAMKTKEVSK